MEVFFPRTSHCCFGWGCSCWSWTAAVACCEMESVLHSGKLWVLKLNCSSGLLWNGVSSAQWETLGAEAELQQWPAVKWSQFCTVGNSGCWSWTAAVACCEMESVLHSGKLWVLKLNCSSDLLWNGVSSAQWETLGAEAELQQWPAVKWSQFCTVGNSGCWSWTAAVACCEMESVLHSGKLWVLKLNCSSDLLWNGVSSAQWETLGAEAELQQWPAVKWSQFCTVGNSGCWSWTAAVACCEMESVLHSGKLWVLKLNCSSDLLGNGVSSAQQEILANDLNWEVANKRWKRQTIFV